MKHVIIVGAGFAGKKRQPFNYRDKGQLATMGKSRAIADMGLLRFEGFSAWQVWIFVHSYFITGFNNRFFIFCRWLSSYMSNRKGAPDHSQQLVEIF